MKKQLPILFLIALPFWAISQDCGNPSGSCSTYSGSCSTSSGSCNANMCNSANTTPESTEAYSYQYHPTAGPAVQQSISLKVKLFPNPANDYILVDDESVDSGKINRLLIYSVNGQMVKNYLVAKGQRYDISALKPGAYVIQFRDKQNKISASQQITKSGI